MITIWVFYKSNTEFEFIFMSFALIFHFIAVIGTAFHIDWCINLTDLFFTILMIIGIIFSTSPAILLYLIYLNLLTLGTRYFFKGCLFKLSTKKSHRLLPRFVSADVLHSIMIVIILLKIFYYK